MNKIVTEQDLVENDARLHINNYEIRWNGYWKRFQCCHDGVLYEEFKVLNEAKEFCRKG